MLPRRRWFPLALLGVLSLCGCPDGEKAPLQQNCRDDDPRIGQTANLTTREHGVSGVARIIDNCTIVIENFNYDGGGLQVRVYGAQAGGDFEDGVSLSNDLRRSGGYANETLTITLPVDVTLDDVQSISIWCVTARTSFGDGSFQ